MLINILKTIGVTLVSQFLLVNTLSAEPNVQFSPENGTEPQIKQNQPPGFFTPVQQVGILRELDGSTRTMIISGQKYYYGINIEVHRPAVESSTVSSLSLNTLIGFTYNKDAKDRRILNEIWVLPSLASKPVPSDL